MEWHDGRHRCCWANPKNELYIRYHDEEWGKLVRDDAKLFEMLILECFQAGLSWECILNKREAFRAAFDEFDLDKVIHETGKVSSPLSDAVSADLKKRGMKFAGTVIIYSYLQAVGRIESHEDGCFLEYKM